MLEQQDSLFKHPSGFNCLLVYFTIFNEAEVQAAPA